MKYVVTQDESGKEEIFIFPKNINHNEFAEVLSYIKQYSGPRNWKRCRREPIAAGFITGTCCHGRSETLNLDSRGRLDEMLIE